jgi:hypothetical protein
MFKKFSQALFIGVVAIACTGIGWLITLAFIYVFVLVTFVPAKQNPEAKWQEALLLILTISGLVMSVVLAFLWCRAIIRYWKE